MSLFGSSHYSVFELYAGEDFSTNVVVNENGVPLDITNIQNMTFIIRRSPFYDKDIHTLTVSKVQPYNAGTFKVEYPASETIKIKAGNHFFDFFADVPVAGGGYARRKLSEGIVVVYPSNQITPGYYPF